ncbi:MAG: hypothetical protein VKJ04_06360 [Vampirovibrionales bacterium]|nr:hypothetical protein [Vampirovibrionales bacterium]
MIGLNIQNVSKEKIGATHGVEIDALFGEYRGQIADIVTRLYAEKDTEGGWKKWLNLGYDETLAKEILAYAKTVESHYEDLVILGIGGSSLGGYALLKALLHPYWNNLSREKRGGFPRFHFIENVDADQINGLLDILEPKTTLVNVITKSGTTAETMSAFMILKEWLEKSLTQAELKKRLVLTTDKKKGLLRQIANEGGYTTFEVPDDVGGRFSIFSAVGLLPAALCGVDIGELQRGIKELDAVLKNSELKDNPAAQNAVLQIYYYKQQKPISVFMPYSYRLAAASDWYVQLWAESLGKKKDLDGKVVHEGPTPVRAVGVTDQHSQVQLFNEGPNDKIFTFIEVTQPDQDVTIPQQFNHIEDLQYLNGQPISRLMGAEFESTRASITSNQRPNVTLTLKKVDAFYFAQLLYFLEVQTAIAGALLNIDPFDQPGVELAKVYTHALMGKKGYEHLVDEARGVKTPATVQ